jgi:elongation factor G
MKRLIVPVPVSGEGRIVRQSGGLHRYGHVVLSVETSPSTALLFDWQVLPVQIPDVFREAIFRGVRRSFKDGAQFDGVSSDGLLVRVVGGSFHETDSNEGSFEIAAMQAFSKALASRN